MLYGTYGGRGGMSTYGSMSTSSDFKDVQCLIGSIYFLFDSSFFFDIATGKKVKNLSLRCKFSQEKLLQLFTSIQAYSV